MGWLVAWAVIALGLWLVLVFMAGSVPSTVQASNRDVLVLAGLSLACSAMVVALAYAGVSLFQGIF